MSAGYPATGELLKKLDAVVREGTDIQTEEAWKRFCRFRESSSGVERTILFSTNPEVVLTFPDLLAAALEADDADIEADTYRVIKAINSESVPVEDVTAAAQRFEARYTAPELTPLQAGREARRDFLRVLNVFLAHRHYEDGQATNTSARDALRRELRWLQPGDVVVTTNWDTAVERTLLEENRWTPADGYGFPIELVQGFLADGLRRYAPLPEWIPRSSQIRVLKLHGSFGWITPGLYGPRVTDQGDIYLDYSEFLSQIPFSKDGELVAVYD